MKLKIVQEQKKVPEERTGRKASESTQKEFVLNYGCSSVKEHLHNIHKALGLREKLSVHSFTL